MLCVYIKVEYVEMLQSKGESGDLKEKSYLYTRENFEKFVEAIKKQGWMTSYNLLGASEWRATWSNLKKQ